MFRYRNQRMAMDDGCEMHSPSMLCKLVKLLLGESRRKSKHVMECKANVSRNMWGFYAESNLYIFKYSDVNVS